MGGMHSRRVEKKLTKILDESGAVMVIMAAVLFGLCGVVALAVDIGHRVVAQAELQRTADAGALSGAVALIPNIDNSLTPLWYNGLTPLWNDGKTAAANTVNNPYNGVNNSYEEGAKKEFNIASTDVIAGYWLLKPQGQDQTFPQTEPSKDYIPVPAIKATLSRTVQYLFARVIGINEQTIYATAIAVVPISYSTGPLAMAVDHSIVFYPDGRTINLSPQDFGWKDEGQWYTIQDATHTPPADGSNDVPEIRKNVQIKVGDQIWIAPGAMTTLYSTITYPQMVIMPVVNSTDQKTWQTILGYAAFQITGVDSKSISGHFLDKFFSPDVIPEGGIYYGVAGTPKLVSP